MKAALIHEFGPADVLKIADAPEPKAAPGEVLVRVRAVRVGGLLDIGTRAGRNPFARLTFPHILGADFAGDLVEVGDGVTRVGVLSVDAGPSGLTVAAINKYLELKAAAKV